MYSLTDPTAQRVLRDPSKNKKFRKVVLDLESRGELLLCESDSFVFCISLHTHHRQWFIKRNPRLLSQSEKDLLHRIAMQTYSYMHFVQGSEYWRALKDLQKDLQVCAAMVRCMLE